MSNERDVWAVGDAYEAYIGRWSRPAAAQLVDWLALAPGAVWLDVGCGTGALTAAILTRAAPARVVGADASASFVAHARTAADDARASFVASDGRRLALATGTFDSVVSGLMLNFVPEPDAAVREMARAARPGGVVAAYVWDYAGKMELLRAFWDAAIAGDPTAAEFDEARRFAVWDRDHLPALFASVGLAEVAVRAIDVPTLFRDFDDYWGPFLGGQGPAPAYVARLDPGTRAALRDRVRAALPVASDGSISLVARAWAARGRR